MADIKRRLLNLEERLMIGQEPIIREIERIITDDQKSGEVLIRRIKHNPDGTVEYLEEELRQWQEEDIQ